MSNQVHRNSQHRYDLANISRATYELQADTNVNNGAILDIPFTERINTTGGDIEYLGAGNFKINTDGLYSASLCCSWASNAVGSRGQYIFYPNNPGFTFGRYAQALINTNTQAGQETIVNTSVTFHGIKEDLFTVKATQTSGGILALDGVPQQTTLIITRIA